MERVSTFRERLKSILEERGMTQAELCRLTSIDRGLMWHYLHGDKFPRIDNIRRIASVLYVNAEWLEGFDTEKTPKPVALSALENDMILTFRSLSGEDKFAILEIIKKKAGGENGLSRME